MEEELRDQLDDMLSSWNCPDTAAKAVMELIAPILAERDQFRAVADFAEAQRAHQRQRLEELRENDRHLRQTLREIEDLARSAPRA